MVPMVPICRVEIRNLDAENRTDWGRKRVGLVERGTLIYVHYHVYNS